MKRSECLVCLRKSSSNVSSRLSTHGRVEEKGRKPAGQKLSSGLRGETKARCRSRMAGRPRCRLLDGEVVNEGEREMLRGEGKQGVERERVTFDDVLAELGEFGREQKVYEVLEV